MKRVKKAQSILEYVIILTAIILGIVAVSGGFKGSVKGMIEKAGNKIGGVKLD